MELTRRSVLKGTGAWDFIACRVPAPRANELNLASVLDAV
jgi:hypothetical protein